MLDKSSAILVGKRTAWSETIDFEALVPSFDFPVFPCNADKSRPLYGLRRLPAFNSIFQSGVDT
jgi:hypothetical protein